ncbi:hypothetical protein VNO78_10816 [Psophocarpus tetragonolobus]|uniref:Uncharacterized protein n=1 Tax=Psophocarpus tetragonolobus TaxID=3891 RepID=A0AAN9SKC9_PSOTE
MARASASASARRIVVVGLMMLAIVGVACAEKSTPTDDYDDEDYSIGTLADEAASSPNGVVAAPIGGPVPPGAFYNAKYTSSPTSTAAISSLSAFAFAFPTAFAAFLFF